MTAVALDKGEARLLHAARGQPAFLIQRVTRDDSDKVTEYVRSIYRENRYEASVRLHC